MEAINNFTETDCGDILIIILWHRYFYTLHILNKETADQRGSNFKDEWLLYGRYWIRTQVLLTLKSILYTMKWHCLYKAFLHIHSLLWHIARTLVKNILPLYPYMILGSQVLQFCPYKRVFLFQVLVLSIFILYFFLTFSGQWHFLYAVIHWGISEYRWRIYWQSWLPYVKGDHSLFIFLKLQNCKSSKHI